MELPATAEIVEVAPRDGLQDEPPLPLSERTELLRLLARAGLRRIEFASFVHPRWIPSLADADELARMRPLAPGVVWSALVPNGKGLERALRAGVDEVTIVVSASDAHNRANLNRTTAESLAGVPELARRARAAGVRVRGAVATAFGCPFEGAVPCGRVADVALVYAEAGADEIVLADTIGVGHPRQVAELAGYLRERVGPDVRLALHLHDRRGFALANVLAALQCGIRVFDAAVTGVGGCPYAPGAPGNVATESVVSFLESMGVETGVDPDRLREAGSYLAERLALARGAAHEVRSGAGGGAARATGKESGTV